MCCRGVQRGGREKILLCLLWTKDVPVRRSGRREDKEFCHGFSSTHHTGVISVGSTDSLLTPYFLRTQYWSKMCGESAPCGASLLTCLDEHVVRVLQADFCPDTTHCVSVKYRTQFSSLLHVRSHRISHVTDVITGALIKLAFSHELRCHSERLHHGCSVS